ncbi:twin-arginine translocase TatA/TatE family subunit [Streptomyces bauhiniae]|uniref:twin-arginine translocase TatA/TatE family subunit n=1 Tax=Streptomyces bauhiniae TaxID=2340725 RepID=UPI0035DC4F7C
MFGLSEVALLLVVLIVLLGVRKLPGLGRSAGQATRIFKSEARALRTQDAPPTTGPVIEGTVLPRDERS